MENGETGSRNGNNQQEMPDNGFNVIIQIKFHSVMLTGSRNGNNQQEMPDNGFNVIIQIKFHSVMLLGNFVEPFSTVR